MTPKEALEHFKKEKDVFRGKDYEAAVVAIEAIEKVIPKKPEIKEKDWGHIKKFEVCPVCGGLVVYATTHCEWCGQHIDWSEYDKS